MQYLSIESIRGTTNDVVVYKSLVSTEQCHPYIRLTMFTQVSIVICKGSGHCTVYTSEVSRTRFRARLVRLKNAASSGRGARTELLPSVYICYGPSKYSSWSRGLLCDWPVLLKKCTVHRDILLTGTRPGDKEFFITRRDIVCRPEIFYILFYYSLRASYGESIPCQ